MNDKNWQARAVEFAAQHNLYHPAGVYALDAMSELGEVAKEILLATNYGEQAPQFRNEIAGELGDLLYSICLLASASDIDLEEAFTATLEKYRTRWAARGDLGSESVESSPANTKGYERY
ncbi:MAG: MazG nucleotide pyrophosphohydrolase domain-containing protein [Candidatus Promineifilaceae bacterium]|nr:MazG nucleotide pyrophosphohydrolase domain-containing protein [Candidatus Promineifilaceae bacterium]